MSNTEWGIDKRISVADLLAVLCSAAMVLMAYATLDKRIAVIEAAAMHRTEDMREIKTNVEYIRRTVESLQTHQERSHVP